MSREKSQPLEAPTTVGAPAVNLSVVPASVQPATTLDVQPSLGGPIMPEGFITTTEFMG